MCGHSLLLRLALRMEVSNKMFGEFVHRLYHYLFEQYIVLFHLVRLYVNGTLRAQQQCDNAANIDYMKLFVGSPGPSGYYCSTNRLPAAQFLGTLDELRIFNTEITPDDVRKLYTMQ